MKKMAKECILPELFKDQPPRRELAPSNHHREIRYSPLSLFRLARHLLIKAGFLVCTHPPTDADIAVFSLGDKWCRGTPLKIVLISKADDTLIQEALRKTPDLVLCWLKGAREIRERIIGLVGRENAPPVMAVESLLTNRFLCPSRARVVRHFPEKFRNQEVI